MICIRRGGVRRFRPRSEGGLGTLEAWPRSRSREALRRPLASTPPLIADCATVALERDPVTILSYGLGGGYGPLRELLAARHAVSAGRVYVTVGGLGGFVHYASAQLERKPGRVLVEAPTYDRPLKLLGWQGAEIVALPMDERGARPRRAGGRAAPRRRDLVPLHDPDVPEPERPDAG